MKEVDVVMGMVKSQIASSEIGMLQTCEGSEWGDGYGEEADCEFWDWHVTHLGRQWVGEEADGEVWDWHVTDLWRQW
jgi:hypothetical protein